MPLHLGRHSYAGRVIDDFQMPVTVGNFTSIAYDLRLLGKNGIHPWTVQNNLVSTYPFREMLGWDYPHCGSDKTIRIGSDVWIGQNVTIVCGVRDIEIGDGAIIGAGAVVTRSIPPYAVAAAVPAKLIRWRYAPRANGCPTGNPLVELVR